MISGCTRRRRNPRSHCRPTQRVAPRLSLLTANVQSDALKIDPKGSSPVYATITVETRPALMPIEPENNGFSIERTYEKVNADGNIAPPKDLRIGDLILVTLDINIPTKGKPTLAIDDALPAIFEAVNPTFKTQATQKVNQEKQKRRLYANYREIKKDRVLFFADSVYRSGDYSLQYLARVVAPGEVTAPPAKIEAMYEPQRFGLSGQVESTRLLAICRPAKSRPFSDSVICILILGDELEA